MVMMPEDATDSSSAQGVGVGFPGDGVVGSSGVLSIGWLLTAFRSSSGIPKTWL